MYHQMNTNNQFVDLFFHRPFIAYLSNYIYCPFMLIFVAFVMWEGNDVRSVHICGHCGALYSKHIYHNRKFSTNRDWLVTDSKWQRAYFYCHRSWIKILREITTKCGCILAALIELIRGAWQLTEAEGLYLPNCKTNLIFVLRALSLFFWHFINTTA